MWQTGWLFCIRITFVWKIAIKIDCQVCNSVSILGERGLHPEPQLGTDPGPIEGSAPGSCACWLQRPQSLSSSQSACRRLERADSTAFDCVCVFVQTTVTFRPVRVLWITFPSWKVQFRGTDTRILYMCIRNYERLVTEWTHSAFELLVIWRRDDMLCSFV